jgi:hypothetical protein
MGEFARRKDHREKEGEAGERSRRMKSIRLLED